MAIEYCIVIVHISLQLKILLHVGTLYTMQIQTKRTKYYNIIYSVMLSACPMKFF